MGHADIGQKCCSKEASKCKDPSAEAAPCILGKARMSAAWSGSRRERMVESEAEDEAGKGGSKQ